MLPTERGDVSQEIVGNRRAPERAIAGRPGRDRPCSKWTMAAVIRLRPATTWVVALIFALALSVLSSPRPDAPPPALLAPT
jgi:hypothetical protein